MSDFSKSMPVMVDVPSQSEDKSQLIGITSKKILFAQDVVALEVANNSTTATIYLNIDGTTATLNKGIPIYPQCYYAAERKIALATGICLISTQANSDVRVIGHFEFVSELK